MFDRIVRFSVYRPGLAFLGAFLLLLGSVLAFRGLAIDAVPDISNVQVQILTRAGSMDGETIEANITYPIESAMGAVPNVKEVRSVTRFGLSAITVVFEEGADIYRARQLVSEQLQTVDLDAKPRLGPIATGLGEIYHYSLDVKNPSDDPETRLKQLMRLRTVQEWDVKRRLLSVAGVAEVNTIGGFREVYFVKPGLEKMAAHGVHFDEIEKALAENNRNAGGGYIQQDADQIIVQGKGLFRSVEEIRSLPVKQLPDLTTLRIGDLAIVGQDREIRTGAAVINGRQAVLGTVFMLLGENSRTVSQRVDARVQEIQRTLPDDIVLKPLYDRSYLVDGTIETVRENLIYGALLVVVVLLLLTGNFRAAFIAAAVIPLSMAATLLLMYVTDLSANLMSLGALDFGIIIDGAVIVVDRCAAIVSRRSKESGRILERWEIKDAVADATVEIRRAAGFGQIIILMVFLPLFALTGIEGKMFRPMAGAFCFALLSAFILAFTVVPALAGLLLKTDRRDRSPIMDWIDQKYSLVLSFFLQRRWWVLGASFLLLVAGSLTFFRLGGEFIPQLYERAIAMQMIRPPSIALDSSVELERISQRVLKEFPEVKDVFARIGSAEIATDPMGVNLSDCYIMLKPRSDWPEVNGLVRTPQQLREALQEAVEARVPGQRILMSQPIQLRFNELLEGARADLVLKIYGEDLDQLQHLSRKAASIIASVDGVSGAEPEIRGKVPLLQITPRDGVLRDLGMSRSEILDTVDMGLGGQDTGFLYRGVRRFPVRIRLSNEDRTDLRRLQSLPVGVTDSSTIPLGRLANVRMEQTFSMIKRDSMQRRGAVLINPAGDTQSIVEKADIELEKKLNLPEGYYIQWGGNFKNLQEALARLSVVAPIAFLFVALMIYSAFQDWVRTLLVLSGVPFALVGGVIGLALSGLPFSISAGVGFIALFGIAVLNGVVLMSHYGRLQSLGSTGFELATEGARARLRAVLMTALTDIFGFLPMMVATGLGAEVQRPLATVVVSGIFTSTFVVLILFPVLHSLLEPYLREIASGAADD